MKANSNFREQVGQVTSWFKDWSECEQTVALYSLLKKLTPPQAKFLDQVLQQSLAECADVKQMQKKANDEGKNAKISLSLSLSVQSLLNCYTLQVCETFYVP